MKEYTREQILECLWRQLPENLLIASCGKGCPYCLPGAAMCEYVGEPLQYDLYISLLRDSAVPEEKAAPLLAVLERCANMDDEECAETCPYYESCGGLSPGEVLSAVYEVCREAGLYDGIEIERSSDLL